MSFSVTSIKKEFQSKGVFYTSKKEYLIEFIENVNPED